MKILVINAGSSSLKYQLIDMDGEQMLCKGNCERIGLDGGIFTHKTADGRELHRDVDMPDHTAAFTQVKEALLDSEKGVIKATGWFRAAPSSTSPALWTIRSSRT